MSEARSDAAELEMLRYPIGRFQPPAVIAPEDREKALDAIETLPGRLAEAVEGLSDDQLDTPYRPGGWTVLQLVHHVADSHSNAVIRWRWALTEEEPTIKAYDERAWAELPDARSLPVVASLDLLTALHRRWVALLRALPNESFERRFIHPENGPTRLDRALLLYAWHGDHHVAHVTALRRRQGW